MSTDSRSHTDGIQMSQFNDFLGNSTWDRLQSMVDMFAIGLCVGIGFWTAYMVIVWRK